MAKYDELAAMKGRELGEDEASIVKRQLKAPKGDGLTDMKITKAEQKAKEKGNKSIPCCGSDEKYPYGLELRLDNEIMDKLGIELPEVGEEVTITAKATVTEAAARESQHDAGKRLSCTLQITKLGIKE